MSRTRPANKRHLKNVQVIDGAENCTYDLFAASAADFAAIFPRGRDVEFVEDFCKRVGAKRAAAITRRLWKRPVDKKTARGIHGTLFYQLASKKKHYPTKRESEMTGTPRAVRR